MQKLYSGGVLGILFVFTTTPARGLCLCVNTNIFNAFAAVCAYSTVKNAEKIVEKKNVQTFLQVTAITRFSLSLYLYFSLRIFRTVNLALKNTYARFCVGRAHPRVR